ncbi:hypothetical protein AN958_04944 [Leucoagaricus sp. SymC.cos]|nr:hypothetical protein AN958_04944 [Leucoagaricus sp. SymC.cos]
MSDPPSTPPQSTAPFSYNVRWMTNTFNTRARVESLLGPEQAAGNVSTHDYNAAINFLPGFHRYYGVPALSAVYVLRRPSWSQLRTLGLAAGSAFGSLAVGNALTLKSHYDFVRSLNNPGGFARAVDRIQKQSGRPPPSSPVIQRKYNVEEELHGNIEDRQELATPEPVAEPLSQSPHTQPQTSSAETRPSRRWDQIRAANAATTSSSSWDALRQKHEKPRIQNSGTATSSKIPNEQVDDRTAEQAEFDALLEKERNIGTQNMRE